MYEYKTLTAELMGSYGNGSIEDKEVNRLAAQGWEVVTTSFEVLDSGFSVLVGVMLKKEKFVVHPMSPEERDDPAR
jgi:hypothetical protein